MMNRKMRGILAPAVLAAVLVFLTAACTSTGKKGKPVFVEDLPPLKDAYTGEFLIGSFVAQVYLDGPNRELLTRHFNQATIGNSLKPESVQPEKGTWSFEVPDTIINEMIKEGFSIHGHTLAWHQQSPEWINYAGISAEEARENLITHVQTVMAHYKGRVYSWDVLNEAMADNPPHPENWRASLRETPWLKALGPDYIELLFLTARETDPAVKLYYNDYNLDNRNKAQAVFNMIKELNEKNPQAGGRPLIDGIGLQSHYNLNTSPVNVERSLEQFISLGLEISISELDVQVPPGPEGLMSGEQALRQGAMYATLFTLYKKYADKIYRVTTCGMEDSTSWRKANSPLLFNGISAKPAYYAALAPGEFLDKNREALALKEKAAKTAAIGYGKPVIDAQVDDVWAGTPVLETDLYLLAWQGAHGKAQVLWDEDNLYVLVQVEGAAMNKQSPNAHEQDSVEIFVDENNAKTAYYGDDDGQYRVNFDNEGSFNPLPVSAGFISAARVSGSSYTVEMRIPFKTIKGADGTAIGFDLSINGASNSGTRESVAVWNDLSGQSYRDTSGLGTLTLRH
jgi:endo-1,4-beta-xylanase